MKRSLTIILAAAALMACTKTEQTFDGAQQSEIALTPVSGSMTKAAITDGVFPVRNHIGLYAFYTSNVNAGPVSDYSKFNIQYFNNTEFHCEKGAVTWDGFESDYYWPATGSLVFAGYSLNDPERIDLPSKQNGTPSYDLATDELKITGYAQSNLTSSTYDLLYFGRTAESYSKNATSVPVQFSHALAWIEIQVKGSTGSLMGGNRTWRVTKVMFDEVDTKGDFTYTGTSIPKVKWDSNSPKDIVVYEGDQPLTNADAVIENVPAGTLVIPQAADKLYATIEYDSPAGDPIKEVVEIDIPAQTPKWEAGKKYTYQLTFSPQEILVAPSVDTWPATGQEGNVNTTWP